MTRRIGSLLLVIALLAGASAQTMPQVRAASGRACPGSTGVTVVVDFNQLGGGIVVGCARGTPADGFEALAMAGFSVVQPTSMPGFTCRIDGQPGPDREACVNTPPANAYWSYWNASAGGTWKYSQAGPASRTPAPGTVEGWSWAQDSAGSGAPRPGIDPPAVAAPTPKPTPRATPTPTPRPTAKATPRPTAKATPRPTARPTARPTPGRTPAVRQTPTAATPAPPVASPGGASAAPDATPGMVAGTATPVATSEAVVAQPPDDGSAVPVEAPDPGLAAASSGAPTGTFLGITLLVLVLVLGFGIRSRRRRI